MGRLKANSIRRNYVKFILRLGLGESIAKSQNRKCVKLGVLEDSENVVQTET